MSVTVKAAAESRSRETAMADDSGVWMYAVADSVAPEWFRDVPGIAGGPVRVITAGGLSAAVTTVSLAEFGEQALRRNLEDLAWLETVVRAHHGVIEIVALHGPVLPMRLTTIYHGDASAAAVLARRAEDFTAALRRITGRAEWGVKISAGPPATAQGSPEDDRAGTGASGPGAAFLRRRRTELTARENARRTAAAQADEIHLTLGGLAVASCARPPQDPQLTGRAERMILNGAYLVDLEESDGFTAAVRRLVAECPDLRIELTGPWPPYSFAVIGEPDARASTPPDADRGAGETGEGQSVRGRRAFTEGTDG
jgi:gas vesicle protein GvpL/GvpF